MSYHNNNNSPQSLEEALAQFQRWLDINFNQNKSWLWIIVLLLAIPVVMSSFYTVEPDEEAVVLRFGKFSSVAPPGLHFKLPLGIDRAIKLPTKQVRQEEFGFRTENTSGTRTTYSSSKKFDIESLMLTGDLNVADVEWITQFQISDPKKYLFHTSDPTSNIRDISEAVMRRVVGDRLVTDVLTTGRTEIADQAKDLIQKLMDEYDMGVRIVSIKLQDVNPPDKVKPSFNEVNEAKQEQEKAINKAEEQYNRVIPEARGKAEEQIARAQGYATELVNRAQGDADRFSLHLKEYRRAPRVTRERLYLETVEKLFGRLGAITVVDPSVQGLLPIFENPQSAKGSK